MVVDKRRALKRARNGGPYSQSDLVKAWRGNLRLSFNALYPIEREFFKTSSKGLLEGKNKWLTIWLRSIARAATHQDLVLRDFIQSIYMYLPVPIINYFQSAEYDYWDFLRYEYEFTSSESFSKDDVETRAGYFVPPRLRTPFQNQRRRRRLYYNSIKEVVGTYCIPRNRNHLVELLGVNKIVMILTVEGGHAFGSDRVDIDSCLERIDTVRNQWKHPLFFVTLAHHFDNKLCGHARSFPAKGELFFSQKPRRNGKFTPGGKRVLRHLLGLNESEDFDASIGYRILIDVKHMSHRSRVYFYKVVNRCFDKGDIIPVIASHCAYSGLKTLSEHIETEGQEIDDATDSSGRFSRWNINMCDEDILMIFKTHGLFGLSMDQRILGVKSKQRKSGKRNSVIAIWDSIQGVLSVVYNNANISEAEKPRIWNMISLGSDFGGWIDPINKYKTVEQYPLLFDDLVELITNQVNSAHPPIAVQHLTTAAKIQQVVEGLCFRNAEAFVQKHYPE